MVHDRIRIFAHGQKLGMGRSAPRYAGETIHYINAYFDLDESWGGFDSIRAVWWSGSVKKATVLGTDMSCYIPLEVVAKKGDVMVNLIASIAENGVLTDRFTSYPFKAAKIDADVILTGSETEPITPSQFEQFVENVKDEADRAEEAKEDARGYAEDAETSAQNALASETNASTSEDNAKASELNAEAYKNQAQLSAESASALATEAEEWADKAEQSAGQSGYMFFYIDDDGYIVYERTANVDVDFTIDEDGYICVEAVA